MMAPTVRRWWPLGLFGIGALAMLVLGDTPQSVERGAGGQVDWILPTGISTTSPASEQAWAARHPWGSAGPEDISSSSESGPQAQAVGVVQGARGLQAVFQIPGQPLVRLQQGEPLPGGGEVALVSDRQVDWTTRNGEARSRRMLVDPLPTE